MPNPVVHLNKVLSRSADGVDQNRVKDERKYYMQNMSTNAAPVFYNVQTKKSQSRTTIAKEFSTY